MPLKSDLNIAARRFLDIRKSFGCDLCNSIIRVAPLPQNRVCGNCEIRSTIETICGAIAKVCDIEFVLIWPRKFFPQFESRYVGVG
jgi:DNA polymerase II large subunit